MLNTEYTIIAYNKLKNVLIILVIQKFINYVDYLEKLTRNLNY